MRTAGILGLLMLSCGGKPSIELPADAPFDRIALLIGIDEYKSPKVKDLKGCKNDMVRLAGVLRSRYGFQRAKLIVDEDATRDGIVSGMRWLISQAEEAQNKGEEDVVAVLAYAGHGARVKSREKSEAEKKDNTWVPHDGGKRYKNHIVDDDINKVLARLEELGATVVYITDSCHSGTSFRSADFAGVRSVTGGSDDTDIADAPKGSVFPDLKNRASTRLIHLAACRDHELAQEGSTGWGSACGRFSHSLAQVLENAPKGTTYKELYTKLLSRFARDWESSAQVPQRNIAAGIADLQCFGTARAPLHAVVQESSGRKATLSMGRLHGVYPGAVFAFYKDLADLTAGRDMLGLGEVKEVAVGTCVATLKDKVELPAGAVASAQSVRFVEYGVHPLNELPKSFATALKELVDEGRVSSAGADDPYAVALHAHEGGVRLYSPTALPPDGPHLLEITQPAALKDRLTTLAGIRRLMALSENENDVTIRYAAHKGHEKSDLGTVDGAHRFKSGVGIDITIENTRKHPIWVFGFYDERDLSNPANREFAPFWPGGPAYEYKIAPGGKLTLVPPDEQYMEATSVFGRSRMTLKFLFTNKEYPFESFHHLAASTGTRGAGELDETGRLISDLINGSGNTRGFGAASARASWWATGDVVIDVVK
ncbi:MAG: caspase family protein [Planctomycetota bacterium]|jgi:hypothetical protein